MAEKKEKLYVSDNAQLMAEWNWEKNIEHGFDPHKLTCGSGRKVWWECSKGHVWLATIRHKSNGTKCPYCSNKKVLCGYNDLQTMNPDLAKEWKYDKNTLSPSDVMPNTDKKVWWKCKEGHEWQATVCSRNSGCGCPYCSGRFAVKGKK